MKPNNHEQQISTEWILDAAKNLGVTLPSEAYTQALMGQARGFIVRLLRELKTRQNPKPSLGKVSTFSKFSANVREVLGRPELRQGKRQGRVGLCIQAPAKEITVHVSAMVHLPQFRCKATRKSVEGAHYQTMAFVSDEICGFAESPSNDAWLIGAMQLAATLKAEAVVDTAFVREAKPGRIEAQKGLRLVWNPEMKDFQGLGSLLGTPLEHDLLPYWFFASELRGVLTLMGDGQIEIGTATLPNGVRQLHLWSSHTRYVLHWDQKPDVADLLAEWRKEEAECAEMFNLEEADAAWARPLDELLAEMDSHGA